MWVEIIVSVDEAHAEDVSDALMEAGALSVSVEDEWADTESEVPLYGEPGLEPTTHAWQQSGLVGGQVIESEHRLRQRALAQHEIGEREPGEESAGGPARVDRPAQRAQRVDADARAVRGRVVVDELVPVELVVHAVERGLHERRGALVAQHGDDHGCGPIPVLSGVEVAQIIVECHRRGDDALLALDVERVEIVDEPVADLPIGGDTPGHQREVSGVRLVVVALRAVDHERKHRPVAPIVTGAGAPPERVRGVGRAGTTVRRFAQQRTQRERG